MKRTANDRKVSHRTVVLLHLQDGVVPYLTPKLLEECFPANDRLLLGMSVRDTCVVPVYKTDDDSKIQAYKFESAPADSWLSVYHKMSVPTFDLVDDADGKRDRVSATGDKVMMWTKNGRLALTPDDYHKVISGHASDTVLSLYSNASNPKKIRQALESNERWAEAAIDEINEKSIYVPIHIEAETEATSHLDAQFKWIGEHVRNNSVSGVMLTGWHHVAGSIRRREIIDEVKRMLEAETTESGIGVGVLCTRTFEQIVDAMTSKCSVIGTDYPRILAERKQALIIPLLSLSKKAKSQEPKSPVVVSLTPTSKDISEHAWFRDERPVQEGCMCMSCRLHSRAYLYHLVCASELLAEILLFVHNLHSLLEFIRKYDDHVSAGTDEAFLDELSSKVSFNE